MPTYRGSCHCGRIAFEADGELERFDGQNWDQAYERYRS